MSPRKAIISACAKLESKYDFLIIEGADHGGVDSKIPYIRIKETSSEIFYQLREHVSNIGPEDREKIELINSIAESHIDFEAIDAMIWPAA